MFFENFNSAEALVKKKKKYRELTFKQVSFSLTNAVSDSICWAGSSLKKLIEFSNNNWRGMAILMGALLCCILLIKNPKVMKEIIALFVN